MGYPGEGQGELETEGCWDQIIARAPKRLEVLLGLEPAHHQAFPSRLPRQFVIASLDLMPGPQQRLHQRSRLDG
jgi:hypothetical protein